MKLLHNRTVNRKQSILQEGQMGKTYVSEIIEQPGGMRFSIRMLIFIGIAMIFDGYD